MKRFYELADTAFFLLFAGIAAAGVLTMPGFSETDAFSWQLIEPNMQVAAGGGFVPASPQAVAFELVFLVLGPFYLAVVGFLGLHSAGMLPVYGPWQSRQGHALHPLSRWVALPMRSIPGARSLHQPQAPPGTLLRGLESYRGSTAGSARFLAVLGFACYVEYVVLKVAWEALHLG